MRGRISPAICASYHGDEMLAMGLAPQLRSIKCADGYVLRYRTWSSGQAPRATLVLLNGVMSHSGWFQPLADHVVDAGVKLVGADRRGTGLNESARGDAPSAEAVIDDVARIIEAERRNGSPVHLGGWCWGAVLAVNVAAAYTGELASLVLLAPGLHPTEAVMTGMKQQEGLAQAPGAAGLAVPITDEMFTRGRYLEFIVADELRCRHVSLRFYGIMKKLAMGAAIRLGHLELPMLLVLASADEATDNARTRIAFARLTKPQVTTELIDGAHGLQFEAPARLGRVLGSWAATAPRKMGARCEG